MSDMLQDVSSSHDSGSLGAPLLDATVTDSQVAVAGDIRIGGEQLTGQKPCTLQVGKKLDRKYPSIRQLGAKRALWILSLINLLNFADRYVPSAVKQLIENDLGLNDFQSSVRMNMFMHSRLNHHTQLLQNQSYYQKCQLTMWAARIMSVYLSICSHYWGDICCSCRPPVWWSCSW
jgi:hypothetical protein